MLYEEDFEKLNIILKELEDWPKEVLTSHKSASHLIHKLVFVADMDFDHKNERVKNIINKILKYKSKEGLYQVKMNIPKHFEGTGENQYAWALCDAPLIMYSLFKFKVDYDIYLKNGVAFLFSIAKDFGWPCRCSC
jgi:hypothetical protein